MRFDTSRKLTAVGGHGRSGVRVYFPGCARGFSQACKRYRKGNCPNTEPQVPCNGVSFFLCHCCAGNRGIVW